MRDLRPFQDPLQIPQVLCPVDTNEDTYYYRVEMRPTKVYFHSDLPKTEVWGYNGVVPGPTIEARKDQPVIVEWVNNLTSPHPIQKFIANAADGQTTQDEPGRNPGGAVAQQDPYPAWTVVHLHGGKTPPDSDGWPDNGYLPCRSITFTYPNEQRASLLWYHDHGMNVTAPNVYAGLAGLYILRDECTFLSPQPQGRRMRQRSRFTSRNPQCL